MRDNYKVKPPGSWGALYPANDMLLLDVVDPLFHCSKEKGSCEFCEIIKECQQAFDLHCGGSTATKKNVRLFDTESKNILRAELQKVGCQIK